MNIKQTKKTPFYFGFPLQMENPLDVFLFQIAAYIEFF